jgi:hypothetical protein
MAMVSSRLTRMGGDTGRTKAILSRRWSDVGALEKLTPGDNSASNHPATPSIKPSRVTLVVTVASTVGQLAGGNSQRKISIGPVNRASASGNR